MGFDGITSLLPNAAIPDLSDAAYAAAWDAFIATAPSQDAVFDKMETLAGFAGLTGTYTPSYQTQVNINTITMALATYLRVGSLCFVFGNFIASVPAVGLSSMLVSLPVASDITTSTELSGGGANYDKQFAIEIYGDAASNRAKFQFNWNATGAAGTITYIFAYWVH